MHSQQKEAGHDLIALFAEGKKLWNILFAQMQSGKTDTFLFVACQLLRTKVVAHVNIISGNAETALKSQLVANIDAFGVKYKSYLEEHDRVSLNEDQWDNIKSCISVIWGTQLKTCMDCKSVKCDVRRKTLYIIEESHAAQNKTMLVNKYLSARGIKGDGNPQFLADANAMVLSVSATPFSEMANVFTSTNEWKGRVRLRITDAYIGIKRMVDDQTIVFVPKLMTACVVDALTDMKQTRPFVYCLVREAQNKIKNAIANHADLKDAYDCKTYDSSDESDLSTLDLLNTLPNRHTIIFIKGKCRMGQVINTKHIALCVETAENSNADTLLQGLTGRMCGYKQHHEHLRIMLSDPKGHKLKDLNLYVKYLNGENVVPSGMNIKKKKNSSSRSETYAIVPILIRLDCDDQQAVIDDNAVTDIKTTIIQAMRERHADVINHNDDAQTREIYERFDAPDNLHISLHTKKNVESKTKTDLSLIESISQSMFDRVPRKHGSANGICPDGKYENKWHVNAFIFKYSIKCENGYKIQKNDIYLDLRTTMQSKNARLYTPDTTGREMFKSAARGGQFARGGTHDVPEQKKTKTKTTRVYTKRYNMEGGRITKSGELDKRTSKKRMSPGERGSPDAELLLLSRETIRSVDASMHLSAQTAQLLCTAAAEGHNDNVLQGGTSSPESHIHILGKIALKQLIENGQVKSFNRVCCKCRATYSIPFHLADHVRAFGILTEYAFEYNGGQRRADLACVDDMGNIKYLFEICYSHATNAGDRPEPWVDIQAVDAIHCFIHATTLCAPQILPCVRTDGSCAACSAYDRLPLYKMPRMNVLIIRLIDYAIHYLMTRRVRVSVIWSDCAPSWAHLIALANIH